MPMKPQVLTPGEVVHHLDGATLAEQLAHHISAGANANITAAFSSGTIFNRAPCRHQFEVLVAYLLF